VYNDVVKEKECSEKKPAERKQGILQFFQF